MKFQLLLHFNKPDGGLPQKMLSVNFCAASSDTKIFQNILSFLAQRSAPITSDHYIYLERDSASHVLNAEYPGFMVHPT